MSIHKIAIPLPCWQDRSIKFDTKPIKHLKLRAGEKVLATIDDIDDGTGGKGIGQLQLTNLRFLWFNSGLDTVNLSIGLNCVSNIEIDEQPNMKMLKVFAAHQWDFCFNFILYDTSSTTPDIFKKAITVWERYTATKLFREVTMSCPEITVDDERNQQNGGLSLLSSKERILKIIPGIWNLKKKTSKKSSTQEEEDQNENKDGKEKEKETQDDNNNNDAEDDDEQEEEEEKRLGTLILTNVRFVWIADHTQNSQSENNNKENEKDVKQEEKDVPSTSAVVTNLSIPWVHIEIIGIRGNKQQLAEKQRRQLEIVTEKENQRKQQQQQQEEKTEEKSEEQQQDEAEEAEERAASKTTREVETKSVNVISNNNNDINEDNFLSVFKVTTSGLAGSYNLGFQLPKSFFDERQQKMVLAKEQQQQQQKQKKDDVVASCSETTTTSMEEVLFDFVEELRDYHEDCFHHAEYGVEFSDLI